MKQTRILVLLPALALALVTLGLISPHGAQGHVSRPCYCPISLDIDGMCLGCTEWEVIPISKSKGKCPRDASNQCVAYGYCSATVLVRVNCDGVDYYATQGGLEEIELLASCGHDAFTSVDCPAPGVGDISVGIYCNECEQL